MLDPAAAVQRDASGKDQPFRLRDGDRLLCRGDHGHREREGAKRCGVSQAARRPFQVGLEQEGQLARAVMAGRHGVVEQREHRRGLALPELGH